MNNTILNGKYFKMIYPANPELGLDLKYTKSMLATSLATPKACYEWPFHDQHVFLL